MARKRAVGRRCPRCGWLMIRDENTRTFLCEPCGRRLSEFDLMSSRDLAAINVPAPPRPAPPPAPPNPDPTSWGRDLDLED